MLFKTELYSLFPSCRDKSIGFDTDWAAVESAFPTFSAAAVANKDFGVLSSTMEEDYAVWAASKSESVEAIDVKLSHGFLLWPPKARYNNYGWVKHPAKVVANVENSRTSIVEGFTADLLDGPGTTVSEIWAVIFSQLPETLLYDLGNIVADMTEQNPESYLAKYLTGVSAEQKLWDNKVTLLYVAGNIVHKPQNSWIPKNATSDDIVNVLKADSKLMPYLFNDSNLRLALTYDKVSVKILRALQTLVADLYSWLQVAPITERTFQLEYGSSRNRKCHHLDLVATFWLKQNELLTASLPRLPTWQEFINVRVKVQNAIMKNREGRTAEHIMDAFQHAVLCNSKPNTALWTWMQESNPIYRMLAFS